MEMEEIHTQVFKFPRLDNGVGRIPANSSSKLGQYFNEEEQKDDREITARGRSSVINTSAVDISNEIGYARLRGWHHSSRIFRVSRASGGKDRHSKVLTSKGLRDRRVRLSVSTAIQFYDLQDRLGYDQPSKAVEWLIKAAADSISELPSLNTPFPTTPPKQLSDEHHQQQQQRHQLLSKSACSSTSETSKGSGLTLSKSDARVNNRVKARERARERSAAKEKDSTNDYMNANHISENSTFTELLNSGGNNGNGNANTGSQTTAPSTQQNSFFFQKSPAMDYFNPARSLAHHSSSLFSTQMQPQSMGMPQPFTLSVENNNNSTHNGHGGNNFHELQHFSLIPENLIPVANGNEYNLNFSISSTSSSGIAAGFNSRGTLQSNSSPPRQQQPSSFFPHHYFQRFPSMDGSSSLPLFMGTTTTAASSNMDNIQHHHLFPAAFDGRLQLYYNDHPDHKGKEKN